MHLFRTKICTSLTSMSSIDTLFTFKDRLFHRRQSEKKTVNLLLQQLANTTTGKIVSKISDFFDIYIYTSHISSICTHIAKII